MSPQRASGYARRPDEDYATPAWVARAIAPRLRKAGVKTVWESAGGAGSLADALTVEGFDVVATTDDFLQHTRPPDRLVDAIVTNPPYGDDRRGALACRFIRHALGLRVNVVAMLLRVDFDSGKSRVDLFRDNPDFAGKVVLLDRIKWFEGPSSPSDNHAWFTWHRRGHLSGSPRLAYATRNNGVAP
jgi:hypothetical protein